MRFITQAWYQLYRRRRQHERMFFINGHYCRKAMPKLTIRK